MKKSTFNRLLAICIGVSLICTAYISHTKNQLDANLDSEVEDLEIPQSNSTLKSAKIFSLKLDEVLRKIVNAY